MMKRTTFVADSCTLVLWGSFFHLASPGHIVKRLVLLSLSLLISVFSFFLRLFVSLVDFLSSLSGALESPGTAQTAWTLCLHGSDRMSRSASTVSVRISVSLSRASAFYFCFDQIKTTSSPSWTRLHQCHVTLLDEATSCWLGIDKVKTPPPPCRL